MSNYQIEGFSSHHCVMVGWDPVLNTYFAHVFDKAKDEDEENRDILWVGTKPNEILDICDAMDAVAPFADVPAEIFNQIYSDSHA